MAHAGSALVQHRSDPAQVLTYQHGVSPSVAVFAVVVAALLAVVSPVLGVAVGALLIWQLA